MTFSEFILKARKRVGDARLSSGALITSATEDGIFLTSANMIEHCTDALTELFRTLRSLQLNAYTNVGVLHRLQNLTITADTGYVDTLPTEFSRLLVMQGQGTDSDKIYKYVEPVEWISQRYRTYDVDSGDEGMGGRFFTIMWDATNKLPLCLTLPVPTSNVSVQGIFSIGFESIFTLASTDELPFYEVNDLMLDYVDKHVSNTAQDMTRVQIMEGTIQRKLGELVNELQKTKA